MTVERGVTDVSVLAAKQALPTFLGYIKVTTDRIIYTYFLYNSLCFCASLSQCVCVCVWVYLNLCGQVLDAILWHVTTTKHGPQPIALDTMLIGPRHTFTYIICLYIQQMLTYMYIGQGEWGSGEVERARQHALLDYTCNNNSANRNCTTKTTLCRRVVAISCQFQLPSCRLPSLLLLMPELPFRTSPTSTWAC